MKSLIAAGLLVMFGASLALGQNRNTGTGATATGATGAPSGFGGVSAFGSSTGGNTATAGFGATGGASTGGSAFGATGGAGAGTGQTPSTRLSAGVNEPGQLGSGFIGGLDAIVGVPNGANGQNPNQNQNRNTTNRLGNNANRMGQQQRQGNQRGMNGGMGRGGGGGRTQPIVRTRLSVGFDYTAATSATASQSLQKQLKTLQSLRVARFQNSNLQFISQGQTVVIRGQVGSAEDRDLLVRMAKLEPGISEVKSEMTIASVPQRSAPMTGRN